MSELWGWQNRQLAKYSGVFWVTRWVTCWAQVAVSSGELGAVKGCLCLQRWPEAARVPGQSSPAQDQDPDPGWSHGRHRPGDRWPYPDDHSDAVWGLHGADHCTQAEHNHGLHQVKSLSGVWWAGGFAGDVKQHLEGSGLSLDMNTGSLVGQYVSNDVLYHPRISSPDFASVSIGNRFYIQKPELCRGHCPGALLALSGNLRSLVKPAAAVTSSLTACHFNYLKIH